MFRRALLIASLAIVPTLSFASPEAPVEGKDFLSVKPAVQTQNPKKIEVLAFFAYTCPHCYTYEKTLEPWAAKLPSDVEFKRIPVNWTNKTKHLTQTYYALEQLKKIEPYHEMMFNAVIKEGRDFPDLESVADYLAQNGLNKEEFLKAAKSFSANMNTEKARKTWMAYGIDGTPCNAINGKYIAAPHLAGTREGAIQVMDFLISKERQSMHK